ncbi:MAG: cation:proton antiporter [Coleofasciculus sp.]|uniref:cation:proton antiporter n=1 Tax=Coleofasciculus sp. TaxID=3100458 RepID=UPI003A494859
MDIYILELLVIGLLLLLVTMGSGWIKRLPLSYAIIYLVVGIFLGPYGTNLIQIQPRTELLERITEFVVIVSLFSCGLKMNRPLRLRAWSSTIRLIAFLMPISIFAIAAISHWLLSLNWGAAILLGAILAPTDPVLASEVQLEHIGDRDELRFGLTSEGGLNDSLAFPFVYFGLYWLENNNWQTWLKEWIIVDLIWAIAAGIGMGILVGKGVMGIKQQLQKFRSIDALMEDFIGLGIILITYALTEIINGYGFLAVFVAGLMVQRSYSNSHYNRRLSQLEFTEQLEKLMEVGTILLLGSILRIEPIIEFGGEALIIAGLLIFAIRPLGAWISTTNLGFAKSPRSSFHPTTRWLFGWFGVRGVGSLYYLSYALGKSLEGELGTKIAWITSITVIISIIIHGISATPLMNWYKQKYEL